MTEKEGDREEHRSKGVAGDGVLLQGQPDQIVLTANKDKPRPRT